MPANEKPPARPVDIYCMKKAPLQSKGQKRMTGVEPASKAWEAFVLPMNYIRRQPLAQSQEDSVPHAVTQHYLR